MRRLRPFGRSGEACAQEGYDEEKTYGQLSELEHNNQVYSGLSQLVRQYLVEIATIYVMTMVRIGEPFSCHI